MRIMAISASPKTSGSLTAQMIEQLGRIGGEAIPLHTALTLIKSPDTPLDALLDADALLIAYPLYVDALPAPLVTLLSRLEAVVRRRETPLPRPRIYALCNCGFYEPAHTALSLTMVRHFAERCGLPWGYGLGIGCGPMLISMGDDWSKGPAADVHAALSVFLESMRAGTSGPDVFAAPRFPRMLYKAAAQLGWRQMARKNGARRQLRARPYA